VLLGRDTEKVRGMGHHLLPTYGVGAAHSEKTWRNVLRQLVSLGYLTTDANGHGSLIATAKARPLLKGETTLSLREDVLLPRTASRAERRPNRSATLDAADQPVFDALRAWRLDKAREQSVPPYVIFHDATLTAIAQMRPSSLAALGSVTGVGGRKLDAYGDDVLAVIRQQQGGAAPTLTRQQAEAVRGVSSNLAVLSVLKAAPVSTSPASSGNLTEALRELRTSLSRESGHSAFLVFPNATLEALAVRQPRTLADLQGIAGMGEKRIQAYGERIVEVVREMQGE
jgi:ATP-dependent DNA helicase RecQ